MGEVRVIRRSPASTGLTTEQKQIKWIREEMEIKNEKKMVRKIKNIEEFIAWTKELPGKLYLYRGLGKSKWNVESSALRRLNVQEKESLSVAFKNYIDQLLDESRLRGFGYKNDRKLSDLELLAELQHHGASTCLIDFTDNALIALWFACTDQPQKEGKVIAMATDENSQFRRINYNNLQTSIEKFLNKEQLWIWKPSDLNNRIMTQQSNFVFGDAIIEKTHYKEVIICSNDKINIINELEKSFGINEKYLFNDFIGFALCNRHDKIVDNFTAEYYFSRGVIFQQNKEYKKAQKYYEMALRLDPASAATYNNIGKIMHDLGNYNKAIYNLKKSTGYNSNIPETYNNIGTAYFALHDVENALSYYNKAIELNPQYAEAYVHRGIAKQILKQYENAILDFDKAIELRPQYAGAYMNRGIVKQALDKYQETILDFDKAIEINPQYADAFYNRGLLNRVLGNYMEAISDYDKAIQYNPNHFKAYNNRGILNNYLKKYEEAILDYNKAIELNPELAMIYFSRGNSKRALGNYDMAITDYTKAIDLKPEYAMAFYNRGLAKHAAGDEKGANTDFKTAFKIDPTLLTSGS